MGGQDALNPQGHGTTRTSGQSTPRTEYFDGETPPALSPLDAFALQGRLLAKQFEESRKAGRRLSRLPPSSVERSLSQPRPGYSRGPSSEEWNKSPVSPRFRENAGNYEIEEPKDRPKSQHPQWSGASRAPSVSDESVPPLPTHDLGARVAQSHEEPSEPDEKLSPAQKQPRAVGLGVAGLPKQQSSSSSPESSSRSFPSNTLAPPPSIPVPSSGSGSSSPSTPQPHHESSDDDYYANSNPNTDVSHPRKFSSSSAMSVPSQSPMAHTHQYHPRRSASPASDITGAPQNFSRPSLNFSRPLSRSGTSVSLPSPVVEGSEKPAYNRPARTESKQREHRPPPIEVPQYDSVAEGGDVEDGQASAGKSYIYTKYTLPRGRAVSRNSLVFAGLQTPHFEWKEPLFESPPPSDVKREPTERTERTPSPMRTTRSPSPSASGPKAAPAAKSSPAKLVKKARSPPRTTRRSTDQSGEEEKGPTQKRIPSDKLAVTSQQQQQQPPPSTPPQRPPAETNEEASKTAPPSSSAGPENAGMLRPSTSRTTTSERETNNTSQLTADDHVEKGIECHENGSVKESTYHLRRAAMQQHPTGMLLYALACRHGWGMRPNQKEGVQWLRKAVDSAELDLNRVTGQARGRQHQEQKALQAQFALGIYELGVSHLNGWGIEQDKALALRCFEIAGQWGDADALAEAGYCYADGIGCKKDLKKAARFYRMAEKKGMSMVGNSWIYKDKYMSDDDDEGADRGRSGRKFSTSSTKSKKSRNKSRTRSIFSRRKPSGEDDA